MPSRSHHCCCEMPPPTEPMLVTELPLRVEPATIAVVASLKIPPPQMVAELSLRCGVGDRHRTSIR